MTSTKKILVGLTAAILVAGTVVTVFAADPWHHDELTVKMRLREQLEKKGWVVTTVEKHTWYNINAVKGDVHLNFVVRIETYGYNFNSAQFKFPDPSGRVGYTCKALPTYKDFQIKDLPFITFASVNKGEEYFPTRDQETMFRQLAEEVAYAVREAVK